MLSSLRKRKQVCPLHSPKRNKKERSQDQGMLKKERYCCSSSPTTYVALAPPRPQLQHCCCYCCADWWRQLELMATTYTRIDDTAPVRCLSRTAWFCSTTCFVHTWYLVRTWNVPEMFVKSSMLFRIMLVLYFAPSDAYGADLLSDSLCWLERTSRFESPHVAVYI